MDIKVKKLFTINYNNKVFACFLADNHRRTFLEVKNNEYIYPNYEDYVYLNNIYNNFEEDIYYYIPEYGYKEKVKFGTLVVAITTVFNLVTTSVKSYQVENDDNKIKINIVINKNNDKYLKVNNVQSYDEILKKVSKEEVHEVINQNPNLSFRIKNIMHLLVEEMTKKYPNADLRTYYLNALDLKVNYLTKEEMLDESKMAGFAAFYSSRQNSISVNPNSENGVLAHELAHPFRSISKDYNGQLIYYSDDFKQGTFILEAMTSKITNLVFPNFIDGYGMEKEITNFLNTCLPFTIKDFLNEGISSYIDKLKKAYPTIDIDYLLDLVDSIRETKATFNTNINLDANPYILDELFLMSKLSATESRPYDPFIAFIKLFKYTKDSAHLLTYFEEYMQYLKEKGYSNLIDYQKISTQIESWSGANEFLYIEDEGIYPLISSFINVENDNIDYTIIKDNQEVVVNDGYPIMTGSYDLTYLELLIALEHPQIKMGSTSYWQHLLIDNNIILNPEEIGVERFVYLNGEKLTFAELEKMALQVGLDENGKIAFEIIKDYEDSSKLNNVSQRIRLSDYYRFGNGEEISKYFNEYYLNLILLDRPYLLSNFYVTEDAVEMVPSLKLVLKNDLDSGMGEVYNLLTTQVILKEDGTFVLSNVPYKIKGSLSLYDIFKEKGILKENNQTLIYNKEDLNDLFNDYLENRGFSK